MAASRGHLQRRRGLLMWITSLVSTHGLTCLQPRFVLILGRGEALEELAVAHRALDAADLGLVQWPGGAPGHRAPRRIRRLCAAIARGSHAGGVQAASR